MTNIFIDLIIYIFSMCLGGLFGVGISFVDSCVMYEIAVNKYYAMYFAFFFLIISLFILLKSYRNYQTNFQNPDFIQVEDTSDKLRYTIFLTLGIMILLSAIISLALHIPSIIKTNYIAKIPLFAILGIGVTFALAITLIDLVNLLLKIVFPKLTRPVINSASQIIPIICISSFMGMLYGSIFGGLDMEDASYRSMGILLQKEQYYCLPIGLILGALSGLAASYSHTNPETENDRIALDKGFTPLSQEEEV